MSERTNVKPTPVVPAVIEVPSLADACAALGLPSPGRGETTVQMQLLPGCAVEVTEVDGPPTPFTYMCVADLAEARRHIENEFGAAQWGPDSVDPKTLRLRGCLLRGGGMVIDAVQCRVAKETAVPCSENCSPFLSFA